MADLVPLGDLSSWLIGDPDDRQELAAAVDDACRSVGFLRLVGHGVRPTLIERMLAVTTSFFDQPDHDKARYVPPAPEINRGYTRRGSEALAYSVGYRPASADLFE